MLTEKLGSAKNINIKNVLNIIRRKGPISKVEIANILNTSKTAMSSYVNFLLKEGMLFKSGKGKSSEIGGKKPILVDLNNDYKYIFGVTIGVHNIKIALAGFKGEIFKELEFATEPAFGYAVIIDRIVNKIDNIIKEDEIEKDKILGIAIGVPGVVRNREEILISPNLPGWQHIKVKEIFNKRLGVRTIVENESKMQSFGEKYYGKAKNSESFISIEAGVGICGGIFLRNQLINGINSKAGEIGHITLIKDGPLCHCGNYGCWETLISIDTLKKEVNSKTGEDLSIKEIADIYKEGNNDVINELIEEVVCWFGIGFSTLLNIIDIEMIILHGEYNQFGQKFLESVKASADKHIFPKIKLNQFDICFSDLDDRAEMLGAFSMILEEVFSFSLKNIRDKLIF
ncbi:MAG: ROK family transcriptional regulator [Bacteroidales bacterium]|nr:ROK family transcriptional regulator [Bacteroidales bacterium]